MFWVHTSNAARFKQSYDEIGRRGKIPGHREPDANIFELVHDWLQDAKRGRWVLVLDNVDDDRFLHDPPATHANGAATGPWKQPLITYIPRCEHGSIILTTRNRHSALKFVHESNIIPIEPDGPHARALLRRKLPEEEGEEDIQKLAETLEFMPLAIVQAVAYMAYRRPRRTVQQYLQEFEKSERKRIRLLEHEAGHPHRDWEAKNSILITWQISFDYIQQSRKSAADLLSVMSFFDRQGIPEYVLRADKCRTASDGVENNPGDDDEGNTTSDSDEDEQFEDDLVVLRNYSFVTTGQDPKMFEMHALVQLATRKWLAFHGLIEPPKTRFIHNLRHSMPCGGYEDWKEHQTLFPHVKAAASMSQRPESEVSIVEWAFLLWLGAWFSWRCGNLADMEQMAVKSKVELDRVLGPDHELTLKSTNMVALAHMQTDRWGPAEEMLVQLLEARRRVLGDEHRDTLSSAENLALVYDNQGRLEAAEQLHLQVLEARKQVLKDGDPEIHESMNNLALTYWRQSRWKDAEILLAQVLESRKQALGNDHPETLVVMSNLALSYDGQSRLEDAEVLHKQVLDARKEIFGEGHPDTLIGMNNLGLTYVNQGRLDEAKSLLFQAFDGRRKALGDQHSDTFVTLNNIHSLALAYTARNQWGNTEPLFIKVMEHMNRVLGEDHTETIAVVGHLAFSYWIRGRYQEAEPLFIKGLVGCKRIYGEESPQTLIFMSNLASTYRDQEQWEEAEVLYVQVLDKRKRILGEMHFDTVATMADLAITYDALGRREDALRLAFESTTIQMLMLWTRILQLGVAQSNNLIRRALARR